MHKSLWLYAGFIVGIILLADQGLFSNLFRLVYQVPGGDTTGHFVLMGILGFLVSRTFQAKQGARRHIMPWGALLFTLLLVSLEESSQLFLAHRTFSLIDLTADYAGILVGGWLALYSGPKGK